MLLQKFLDTIEATNPYRIYVENVRSFFGVPRVLAKFLCEMAVVDKQFIKKIGVVCKNEDCKRIIATYDSKDQIPPYLRCDNCEILEKENFIFKKGELETVEFYQLNKQ